MGLFSSNKPKPEPLQPTPMPSNPVSTPVTSTSAASASSSSASATATNPILSTPTTPKKMTENITTISAGTIIEGTMKLEGDILIEGTVKGIVHSKCKIVLGANGKIDGDINCNEAEVSGKITGKVNVNDMLILKGNALIDGDITTGKLVMESGVRFNGKCNMGAKNAGSAASGIPSSNANQQTPQTAQAPTPAAPPANSMNA